MRKSAREEGTRWLEQAQIDLDWADHLFEEGAYYLVCFLAQQIAEIKGFLYAQGEEMVIGHSVHQLAFRAGEYNPEFRSFLERWSLLDTYYIPTRYPNGLPDGIPARIYNRESAESALHLAKEILGKIDLWFKSS